MRLYPNFLLFISIFAEDNRFIKTKELWQKKIKNGSLQAL
ncbi:hypothetical protein M573_102036 [Prevotella intermedia ZT]|uniref:Uncharacterized protein n=1 Tax=Prevotella intermedia ZT TaxID=1347790 RepID=A0AAP0V8N7_PREIN|nr:hypothetical protein M573_102036 [Prevotella intermedia ZT]